MSETESLFEFNLPKNRSSKINNRIQNLIDRSKNPAVSEDKRKLQNGKDVVKFEDFIEYLMEKDPTKVKKTKFNFSGRNICLYSRGNLKLVKSTFYPVTS